MTPTPSRRPKGFGRVFLRGNTWYGRFRKDGKEITFSTGLPDGKGAREKALKILEEKTEVLRLKSEATRLELMRTLIESKENEITRRMEESNILRLGELETVFRKSPFRPDCSEQQMDRYASYISRLREFFSDETNAASITSAEAGRFIKKYSTEFSPNAYNKMLNGLSFVWRSLSRESGLADPWASIPKRRLDTHTRRVLTEEESKAVIETTQGEMKVLVGLALYTGMRLGDCATLKWEEVKDGYIDRITMKAKVQAVPPLCKELKRILPSRKKSGLVIPSMAAAWKKDSSALTRKIEKVFRDCGITTSVLTSSSRARPDCTFHSFRHTCTSRWIAQGIPMQIVQKYLGHKTIGMTNHYTHLEIQDLMKYFKE